MVFNWRSIYADDVGQEVPLKDAGKKNKKKADERQPTKNGSRNDASDGKNKKNAPSAVKEPKVVLEPIAKIVQASDDTSDIKRRPNHCHQAVPVAIAPAPPSVSDVPPENSGATIQPQAVKPNDHEQFPAGRSTQVPRPHSKVNSLPLEKSNGGDDDDNKKLQEKLDSWNRKLNMNDLKGTRRLVLKTKLHCKGCIIKIRRALNDLGGVKAVAFDSGRNLVAVMGIVNEEKLVWYLEQRLKQEIIVLFPAKVHNNEEAAMPADLRNKQKPDVADDKSSSKKAKEGPAGAGEEVDPLTSPVASKVDEKETNVQHCSPAASAKAGGEREPDRDNTNKRILCDTTSTLNLRIKLQGEGCIEKIRGAITQLKGVASVNIQESSDLVTMTMARKVDTKELTTYLSNNLKREVEVVTNRKGNCAPMDDKNDVKLPVDLEKKSKEGHPEAGCAGKQGSVKQMTPAPLSPIYEKDVDDRVLSGKNSTNGYPPPPMDWNSSVPATYNLDMFNDENPNACSIM